MAQLVRRFVRSIAIGTASTVVFLAPAFAQPTAVDEFRQAALRALGGDVTTLEYSGSGWDACLGQAWDVTVGWARWELTDYRRVIDYANGLSAQSAMRRAGLDPEAVGGCGGQVDAAATAQRTSIAADAPFAQKLPIWLTPHGLLGLAAADNATVTRTNDGYELAVDVAGRVHHRVVAEYDGNYLPRRAQTWIDDPVFGDMEVVARFDGYRDFSGVVFPASLTLVQGGMPTFELTVDAVRAGVGSPEIPPPRSFGGAAASTGPRSTEIGDGVFVMLGSYQAVAVEFDDFAVVIDGLQNDTRTQEVIELTHEAIPGKPIRYIVNTHSHFDHASGLRQYAAEGAVILTSERNVEFFRKALSAPRTLNPDRIEPSRVEPVVRGISERFSISDDSGQRLEIVPLAPSQHAADMLIAWLPRISTVVEADLLQPWINPIFAGGQDGPNPYLVYLENELDRAGIDNAQFVPIHTPSDPPTMPRSVLDDAVGQ